MPESFAEWVSFIASLFTIIGITGFATWGLSKKKYATTTTILIVFISRLTACIILLLIYASVGFRLADILYPSLYVTWSTISKTLTGNWFYGSNTAILDIIIAVPVIILVTIMALRQKYPVGHRPERTAYKLRSYVARPFWAGSLAHV